MQLYSAMKSKLGLFQKKNMPANYGVKLTDANSEKQTLLYVEHCLQDLYVCMCVAINMYIVPEF